MSSSFPLHSRRPTIEPLSTDGPYTRSPVGSSSSACSDPDHEIVPPTHRHRTLVLCFDGTGDAFDDDNSNIVQFFTLLKKDDRNEQMVYYQAGIGTYTIPQIAKPITAKISKVVDSMIGMHLDAHVMGGYEFLMQNYDAGDKIFLFGFSRGAYTARALAGMIHKVGLLPACNHQQVAFAYKMYTDATEKGWKQSIVFKKAFAIDVDIELLGLWDTVGSVGIIPKSLPFTTSSTHIRHFRHAVALDEHRARFKANLWIRPTPEQADQGVKVGTMPKSGGKGKGSAKGGKTLKALERQYTADPERETDIEEVWFAGTHCDVGGGAVPNGTRNNLARIPLRWMIRECFKLNTGILFHREMFKGIGLDPSMLWPAVLSRPPPIALSDFLAPLALSSRTSSTTDWKEAPHPVDLPPPGHDFVSEEEEDLADALSPMYDQLKLKYGWWILEVIPQKQRFQRSDDSWARKLNINMGDARIIPMQKRVGVKIHRSVKLRMEHWEEKTKNKVEKYAPQPTLKVEPTWVE